MVWYATVASVGSTDIKRLLRLSPTCCFDGDTFQPNTWNVVVSQYFMKFMYPP